MIKDVNRIYFLNCNHSLKFTASLQQVKYLDTFPHSISRLICPPHWYFSSFLSSFLLTGTVFHSCFPWRSIHQYILSAFSHFCFYTVTSFSPVSVFCFSHRWISKFFLLHFIIETFTIQSNALSKDTFISHSDPEFKFLIKCQYIFCISPDDYSISLSLLKCKAR